MILPRKALRDVRALRLRAVLLVLVVGVGVGTGSGVGLALRQVQASRDAFYRDYRLADLDVRLARPLPARTLAARARRAGATVAETRLVVDGLALPAAGGTAPAEVVGMEPSARLDRLALLEGAPLSTARPLGALLEADFAHSAHMRVGDRLRLVLAGHRLTVRVRGLARSPEYLLATTSPDYLLIPKRGSLAVLFLPRAALQRVLGLTGMTNDLVADLPPGTPAGAALTLAAGLPVARLTPRSQQFSLRFTTADIRSFSLFAPVVGAVFAAVGLALITLGLRRLVHAQRRELGALLALGYPRRTVVASAVAPAVVLALPGAAVAVLTTIGVGRIIAEDYARIVGFPHVSFTLPAAPLVLAVGLALGASLLAALLPAASLARLRPSDAMRGETPAEFRLPRGLERASAFAGPPLAYALRSLLRRLPLRLATVVSIALAIGLGTALQIIATSTNHAVDTALSDQQWTHSLQLAQPLPTARAVAVAEQRGARLVEPVVRSSAQLLPAHGAAQDAQLVGLPTDSSLERLRIVTGGPPGPGRIVLAEQLAGRLHAHVGESLTVRTAAGSSRLVVAGTAHTLANGSAFLPLPLAARLAGIPGEANGLLVDASPGTADLLRRDPQVAAVTSKESVRVGMHDIIRELTTVIDVLLALSLAVGALFLVASLSLSGLGREGEFATLRALGYGRRAVVLIIGTEALAQTLVATVLSIPLGLVIAWPLAHRLGVAWFQIGLAPQPSDFVPAIALALVLSVLAAAHSARQTLRLDIAATVRARLIG